jgi:polyisoprenoid-binding protein YceI
MARNEEEQMKRTFSFIAVLGVMLFATGIDAQGATWDWEIDKTHSNVGFSVKHLGLSNVKGHFVDYEGKVKADPKTGKLEEVQATAKAASVNTGLEPRDKHLKAPDFFHVDKHPNITLKTKSLKWNGEKLSGIASLTMKGVTKDVPFQGELVGARLVNFGAGPKMRAGYSVWATINRQDFGLSFNTLAEGVKMVDDSVRIELEVQVIHSPAKATK